VPKPSPYLFTADRRRRALSGFGLPLRVLYSTGWHFPAADAADPFEGMAEAFDEGLRRVAAARGDHVREGAPDSTEPPASANAEGSSTSAVTGGLRGLHKRTH
jgi:hypothetical protein